MSIWNEKITKEQAEQLNRNKLIYSYLVICSLAWLETSSVGAVLFAAAARVVLSDIAIFLRLQERWVSLWNRGPST